MSDIFIVPMEMCHVSMVAELEKQCFSDPWSENSIAGELSNPLSLWLVAEQDGCVLGYIGSQSVLGEADVMNMAVAPSVRRHGLGESLLASLCQRLRQHGNHALLLEVRQSNAPAIALYEKMGFREIGVRPNYYFHPRENAKIMRKELMDT